MSGRYRAAPRDASWYAHPDTHASKVVHIDNGDEFAACNSNVILGYPHWTDAQDVPVEIRCQRAACKSRYETKETQ